MPVLKCCAEPGCPILHPQVGRCAAHARPAWVRRPGNGRRRYSYQHDKQSKAMRKAGTLCSYCHAEPMYQLDHEIPISQGGQDIPTNRRPIGRRCHVRKIAHESKAMKSVMHRLS